MEWQAYLVAGLFSLLGLLCVLVIPVGLPGTWMLLGFAALVELFDSVPLSASDPITFGWPLLALCAGLGVVGEVLEAGAGAAGTKLGGGTRRGMVGAIVGGIVGAIVFTPVIPIPLIGTLVGALVGTFVGAFVAETTGEAKKAHTETARAAAAATVGRLAGTLGKTMLATVIWILLARAAFLP
ncbi:MAG: DUF456 domain-containing protein [Myxococcota bacterium]|nr:DUF456 domain-containing protein [Myxococcota bacterium]